MEYLQDESLDKVVDEDRLPENEIVQIAVKVLQGLNSMHVAGYAHRHLKPQVGSSHRLVVFAVLTGRQEHPSSIEGPKLVGQDCRLWSYEDGLKHHLLAHLYRILRLRSA